MKQITLIRCEVMTIGNRFRSKGLTLSQALKKAWQIVKTSKISTKVKGVAYGIGQKALERLTRYNHNEIYVTLERDALNLYDNNAVAVNIGVHNKGAVQIGYLPSPLAKIIAPILDKGIEVKALYKEIRGKYSAYMNYGLEIELVF